MRNYYFDVIDSTSNEAKRIIKNSENGNGIENFYVLADRQEHGRGQFERSFFSPPRTGLYVSVCLRLRQKLHNSFITQAAAVAVCESIEKLHGIKLGIKPVNDIIRSERKVGGILVETSASIFDRSHFAIFGIGLNLYKPEGGFPPHLRNSAGYIFDHVIEKGALVEEIINELVFYTENIQSINILGKYLEKVVPYERKI